jgi:hypothetical protein
VQFDDSGDKASVGLEAKHAARCGNVPYAAPPDDDGFVVATAPLRQRSPAKAERTGNKLQALVETDCAESGDILDIDANWSDGAR